MSLPCIPKRRRFGLGWGGWGGELGQVSVGYLVMHFGGSITLGTLLLTVAPQEEPTYVTFLKVHPRQLPQ